MSLYFIDVIVIDFVGFVCQERVGVVLIIYYLVRFVLEQVEYIQVYENFFAFFELFCIDSCM